MSEENRQYDNKNRGILFPKKDRFQENHPHYEGTIELEDGEHFLNAWIKTSKKNSEYKFLTVTIGPLKKRRPQVSQNQDNEASLLLDNASPINENGPEPKAERVPDIKSMTVPTVVVVDDGGGQGYEKEEVDDIPF